MAISPEQVAELEWANYAATLPSAQVTPGLEVTLRDDVILTSSTSFPTHDSNHACLLRTTAQAADDLIAEVAGFFQAKGLPIAIYVSPACEPTDLPERLLDTGFKKQPEEEAWMILENLSDFDIPSPYPGIRVKLITKSEAIVFSRVFMAAFDMPSDFAPVMAQLLEPTVVLPRVRHYLGFDKEQPIGTCSLLCHESFGVLGSAGVIPEHRSSGAATNLAAHAATEAREMGIDTLMLQTAADTWLERFLRISGFRRAFTRSCYILDDGFPGQD
jgi:ribosomal protein S18 acetylase RimI-like enzyme